MANNQRRMIYAKIWTSEQFGIMSDKAKLLFIGTITLADDDGRLRGNPAYLRGQIFPYEESVSVTDVSQLRNEIENGGLIQTYSIGGCEYIQHPKWLTHQTIRKDLYKPSSLPKRNEAVTKPLRKRTLSQVKLSQDKISQLAEPSSAEIVSVINEFEDTNPSFRKWYGNTTQRGAIKRMLDIHGFEKLSKAVALLPKIKGRKYFPTITTPLQLEDKWASLESAFIRYKGEEINNKTKVAFK